MFITYHGGSALKIQEKEVTVAINPNTNKDMMPKFSAQVALLGTKDSSVDFIREEPFIISKPGEYEVKGVFVYGMYADKKRDQLVYVLELEGITLGVLGGFNGEQLSSDQMKQIEGVDVLFVPVGGGEVLNSKQAVKIINQVEPRIVIPIQYKVGSEKDFPENVDLFLKEYGVSSKAEKIDKLKLTKKDLPQEDTKVIVVTPS